MTKQVRCSFDGKRNIQAIDYVGIRFLHHKSAADRIIRSLDFLVIAANGRQFDSVGVKWKFGFKMKSDVSLRLEDNRSSVGQA